MTAYGVLTVNLPLTFPSGVALSQKKRSEGTHSKHEHDPDLLLVDAQVLGIVRDNYDTLTLKLQVRAAPLVPVTVKFTVNIAVCEESSATAYQDSDCDLASTRTRGAALVGYARRKTHGGLFQNSYKICQKSFKF